MPSYDWFEYRGRRWSDRFQGLDWINGRDVWRDRFAAPSVESFQVVADLARLRQQLRWGHGPLACPRVFISHRRANRAEALAMARIAAQQGFQFWLDILDPTLQMLTPAPGVPPSRWLSLAIAAVIEMALLNCTHVMAIMTRQTHGGMWVPYEYGRVKDPVPYSPQAAAWLHPKFATAVKSGKLTLPEYMLLGARCRTRAQVRTWFARELAAWRASCPRGAGEAAPCAGELPEPPDT